MLLILDLLPHQIALHMIIMLKTTLQILLPIAYREHRMSPLRFCACFLAVMCISKTVSADPIADPFERINRVSFAIHQTLDRFAMRPAAIAYRTVTPDFMETRIRNIFANLSLPASGINAALQGKAQQTLTITARFLINTTLGIAGMFDVAERFGLTPIYEDTAQTFARAGMPSGPYLFIPLLGPSSPRHLLGRAADQFMSPVSHLQEPRDRNPVIGLNLLQIRADLVEPLDDLTASSTDLYASMRSFYWQNREFEILDGETSIDTLPDVIDLGD